MKIKTHHIKNSKIAELLSDEVIIKNVEDVLDLLGNIYYQDFDKIIIHQKDLIEDFFDLQNGVAGEILQKFSNYRIRLAVIGDFGKFNKKSLKDFIFESNKSKHINFVNSVEKAVEVLEK